MHAGHDSVEIQVFGVLRNHWPTGRVTVQLAAGATGQDLKSELVRVATLGGKGDKVSGILGTCALARADGVIADDSILGDFQGIAVLPPVCGG